MLRNDTLNPRSSYSLTIHLFIQHILSKCLHMVGSALGPGDAALNKADTGPSLQKLYSLAGEADYI